MKSQKTKYLIKRRYCWISIFSFWFAQHWPEQRIIFVLSLVLFTFSPKGRKRVLSRLDFDILVQLQFPIQLPCFNFTTITNPYLGVQLFTQKFLSEIPEINFNLQLDLFLRRVGRDVHSTDSDSPWRSSPRLLPNPDSRRRVAAFDPYWRDLLRFCYDFHHCFPL